MSGHVWKQTRAWVLLVIILFDIFSTPLAHAALHSKSNIEIDVDSAGFIRHATSRSNANSLSNVHSHKERTEKKFSPTKKQMLIGGAALAGVATAGLGYMAYKEHQKEKEEEEGMQEEADAANAANAPPDAETSGGPTQQGAGGGANAQGATGAGAAGAGAAGAGAAGAGAAASGASAQPGAAPAGAAPPGGQQSGGGCFPSHATVELEAGGRRMLEEVKVGDKVRVVRADGSSGFEPIAFLAVRLDADEAPEREFLRVGTASGESVTITGTHFIPVRKNGVESLNTRASAVEVGDEVLVYPAGSPAAQWENVTDVSTVFADGFFAPVPFRSSLVVVDGVVASSWGALPLLSALLPDSFSAKLYEAGRAVLVRPFFSLIGPSSFDLLARSVWGDGSFAFRWRERLFALAATVGLASRGLQAKSKPSGGGWRSPITVGRSVDL